jgi:hypothetical protein
LAVFVGDLSGALVGDKFYTYYWKRSDYRLLEMGKSRVIVYLLLIIAVLSFIVNAYQFNANLTLTKQNEDSSAKLQMNTLLTQAQLAVNAELEKLDHSLQAAIKQLSTISLNSAQARTVISSLIEENPLIVTAAVNINDVLVAVEPSEYRYIEGSNVSNQEQNIALHQTLRPAMSDVITLVQGSDGVVMVAPIFKSNGAFLGAVSIVIQPSVLINKTVTSVLNGSAYSFMAIQLDGRVIYDADQAQIGKMTLTDPEFQAYPQLLALCRRMAVGKAGYGTYAFNTSLASTDVVKKECYWTTIGIYTKEWRLAIIHTIKS